MDENLYHSGILGMHWGIRRYQNLDGSLTPEGRARYSSPYGTKKTAKYRRSDMDRMTIEELRDLDERMRHIRGYEESRSVFNRGMNTTRTTLETIGKVGAAVTGVATGAAIVNRIIKDKGFGNIKISLFPEKKD